VAVAVEMPTRRRPRKTATRLEVRSVKRELTTDRALSLCTDDLRACGARLYQLSGRIRFGVDGEEGVDHTTLAPIIQHVEEAMRGIQGLRQT